MTIEEIEKLELFLPRNLDELSEIKGKPTIFPPRGSHGTNMAYFGDNDGRGLHEFIKQMKLSGPSDTIVSIPVYWEHLDFTSEGISGDGYIGRSYSSSEDGYTERFEVLKESGLWVRPKFVLRDGEYFRATQ